MRLLFCLVLGSALLLAGCDASITSGSREARTYTISLENGEASNDAPDPADTPELPELKPNQFGGNEFVFDVVDGAARANEAGRVTVAFTSFKIDSDELRKNVTYSGTTPMNTMLALRSAPGPYIAFTFFLADETKGLTLENVKSWFCAFYIIEGKAFAYQDEPGAPSAVSLTRLEGNLKEGGTVHLMAKLPVTAPSDAEADYYYFDIDRMVGVFKASDG